MPTLSANRVAALLAFFPSIVFAQGPDSRRECETIVNAKTFDMVCPLQHKAGLTSYHMRGVLNDDDQTRPDNPNPETATYAPQEMEFYRGNTSVQKIVIDATSPLDLNLSGFPLMQLLEWVDLNGDGYLDFRLLSQNTRRNPSYLVYLYDALHKVFQHSVTLDDQIGNGEIEIDPKGIISITTFCCVNVVESITYKWKGNVLNKLRATSGKTTDD